MFKVPKITIHTPLYIDKHGHLRVINEPCSPIDRREELRKTINNLSIWICRKCEYNLLDADEVFERIEMEVGMLFGTPIPFHLTLERFAAINDAINSFIS